MKTLNLVKFSRLVRKVLDERGEGPGRWARKNEEKQGDEKDSMLILDSGAADHRRRL